jgi:hypothetical protein
MANEPTQRMLAVGLAVVFLSACVQVVIGSGDVRTEELSVAPFTELELVGSATVIVERGERQRVEVEAQPNILDILETRTSGDRLILGETTGVGYTPSEPVTFRVTVPRLEEVEVSGSGEVSLPDARADRMVVRVSGSGTISLSGAVDDLRVAIDGSGSVTASGSAKELRVDVSGSGSFEGVELSVEDADVRVSGSGSAAVKASGRLEADVSGSGSIAYVGEPAELETSIEGSGSIRRR